MPAKKTCAAAALALVVSGCATSSLQNKDAFSPDNRFALVSFGGFTSGLGMSEAEDNEMITNLDAVVIKELSQSKHFQLAPERSVKASRAYAVVKGEPTGGLYSVKVARGYKKFDVKKQIEAVDSMMDELHLSGVIQVTAVYGKSEKTAFVSGLIPILGAASGGVARGTVNYSIVAYDRQGEVIWRDTVEAKTHDSTLVVMGIANVGKLYPQLVDITQDASRQALKDLDDKLGH